MEVNSHSIFLCGPLRSGKSLFVFHLQSVFLKSTMLYSDNDVRWRHLKLNITIPSFFSPLLFPFLLQILCTSYALMRCNEVARTGPIFFPVVELFSISVFPFRFSVVSSKRIKALPMPGFEPSTSKLVGGY